MTTEPLPLRTYALAALARWLEPSSDSSTAEALFLRRHADAVRATGRPWVDGVEDCLGRPAPADTDLVRLSRFLGMSALEVLAVALAAAVEEDPLVGRAMAFLQAPLATSRPTLGLLARALGELAPPGREPLHALASGPAVASGLLTCLEETAPLAEQLLSLPLPLYLALAGHDAPWPGTTLGMGAWPEVQLPPSIQRRAEAQAETLQSMPRSTLVLRSGFPSEGRAVASAIARALGQRALFIEGEQLRGLAPYLFLRRLLPVHVRELAPGERKVLPSLGYHTGPVVALAGPDGALETAEGAALRWTLPVPDRTERRLLWESAVEDPALAEELATQHRHGIGRIAQLSRLAKQSATLEGREHASRADVFAAARDGEGGGLGTLAEPLTDAIEDAALVISPQIQRELMLLLARCRTRDGLVEGLGPSAAARYRAGVRALFVGPSGTGKTLAAGWMATKLGVPLYRVDLASVTSKYIGETEKNLAQLFARAENADVVLLFDEADSMFGKRTDVKDSNDRFANAQTNYLLQRIEAFDGIALLTSNSKSRFDQAFMRRLDAIIDFPTPGPAERRALWESHLGTAHGLTPRDLGRLAATVDMAGGQIRNVVLTAAILAKEEGRPIQQGDVIQALAHEYRKIGRELPSELRVDGAAAARGTGS